VNCFLRYNSLPRDLTIKTWTKIIDPYGIQKLSRESYLSLFEKLARGNFSETPSMLSINFSERLSSYLEE